LLHYWFSFRGFLWVRIFRTSPAGEFTRPQAFLAGADGGWVNAQVLRANEGFA
jgi:hypothetical protein